ncbi:MAG: phosphoesterase, partial [Clostridia bacterium]|nr:phosphoesterase [Clostridia bacterium]
VGLTVIPGMELTTAEEVHIVCLFKTLNNANLFWQEVEKRQPNIKNKEEVFGEQVFLDENDEEIKREERLLIVATTIGVYDVVNLVNKFGGVCYPAHIDRTSNGILAILGGMDKDMGFEFAEVSRKAKNVQELNPLGLKILRASDAHHIGHIFEMDEADSVEISSLDIDCVFKALFNK